MATYMVRAAYTTEKWADMVAKGGKGHCTERMTVRPVIEKLGGTVVCGYVAFGEWDAVVIYDIPDPVGAVAVSAALTSTGIFKAVETTPLIPAQEADQGLALAKAEGYGQHHAFVETDVIAKAIVG